VITGDEQAVLLVAKVFGRAAGTRGDHRRAAGHGLKGNESPWLLPANGEDQCVARAVDHRELCTGEAGLKSHPTVEPRILTDACELCRILSIDGADDVQRVLRREVGECPDGNVDALDARDPADVREPTRERVPERLSLEFGDVDAGAPDLSALERA